MINFYEIKMFNFDEIQFINVSFYDLFIYLKQLTFFKIYFLKFYLFIFLATQLVGS